jgi:hypothetical protein
MWPLSSSVVLRFNPFRDSGEYAMAFDALMTDTVFIEKPDGRRIGPYKGALSKGSFTIMDKTLDVDHGDLLIRPLPNGKEEHYTVLRADFREDFHSIPGGYDLSLSKIQQIHSRPSSVVNNVNISNSSGFQVGNHNLQSFQVALNQLLQAIESHPGSNEQKEEAKSRLEKFLAHPLVVAVLGGVSGGLAG